MTPPQPMPLTIHQVMELGRRHGHALMETANRYGATVFSAEENAQAAGLEIIAASPDFIVDFVAESLGRGACDPETA